MSNYLAVYRVDGVALDNERCLKKKERLLQN
jgi:hypothetical protein